LDGCTDYCMDVQVLAGRQVGCRTPLASFGGDKNNELRPQYIFWKTNPPATFLTLIRLLQKYFLGILDFVRLHIVCRPHSCVVSARFLGVVFNLFCAVRHEH
ncbi:MAG: hypothetical protein ACO22U_13560, partial [bacterium]